MMQEMHFKRKIKYFVVCSKTYEIEFPISDQDLQNLFSCIFVSYLLQISTMNLIAF